MQPPSAQVKTILVAEDDPDIRELVITRLALAGYRTSFASDGATALQSIIQARPSAVVLDINMPNLSGLDVLERLRREPALARIPVLMLTARGAPQDVRDALKLGAKDYLTKPFDDQELLRRVNRLLRPVRPVQAPAANKAAQTTPQAPGPTAADPSDDVELI